MPVKFTPRAQQATSRGRRRETPGDPRPSTCAPTTHPGYFDGAGHDGAIAWRLIPRAARANAVRKLPADDGEQSENGRVQPGRRSRATRRQEHAPSRTCWITRIKKIRGSLGRHLRREPRKPATRDAASNIKRQENADAAKAEGGAVELA